MPNFVIQKKFNSIYITKKQVQKLKKQQAEYYSSPEFYAKHPDLTPSDFYLATGRIATREMIDKGFKEAFKLPFKYKCILLFKRLRKIFY